MKVAISGATGFIGAGLIDLLLNEGHEVIALTRDSGKAGRILRKNIKILDWSKESATQFANELDAAGAFINLAGENIGSSLWTQSKKRKIADSRIHSGKLMTEAIRSMKNPPAVLVQASAVGYYGSRGDEIIDESSGSGTGFLPEVCLKWESSTADVEVLGVRRVLIRSGVVLSRNGGAFSKLALPYRLHVGTILGSGRQWLPWIHYEDEIKAIYFLMSNDNCAGAYNLVAPNPARMEEICNQIGRTLFRMPDGVVELLLGQMGRETVLVSQRVIPKRLLDENFNFRYSEIHETARDLIR